MKIFQASNIAAGYGRSVIVHGVGIGADKGQVIALVGPNGAGKSTFLKALAGLLRLQEGQMELAGRDVTGLPAEKLVRAGLSYVPQVKNVFPTLSIRENLEMGGYTRKSGVEAAIQQLFDMFPDLKLAEHKQAGQLSGGQRTLLGLARALMLEPKVMLLDEPTAGVAPRYVEEIWRAVGRIAATGTAVIVVEQNVDRAIQNADIVQVMVAGQTRLSGTPAELDTVDLGAIFLGGDSGGPAELSRTGSADAPVRAGHPQVGIKGFFEKGARQ